MNQHLTPIERLGVWGGLIGITLLGFGWIFLAQFIPPVSATATAQEVATYFADRRWQMIQAGNLIMLSVFFILPAFAAATMVVNAMEKRLGMLTIMMIGAGATNAFVCFILGLSWVWGAYRADQNPELVRFAYDFGFLIFYGGIAMFIPLFFVPAYAILIESPKQKLVPRWYGYLNLLTGFILLPAPLVYFFKTGPFAWDGIINFWIPFIDFAVFFTITPFVIGPALKQIRASQSTN